MLAAAASAVACCRAQAAGLEAGCVGHARPPPQTNDYERIRREASGLPGGFPLWYPPRNTRRHILLTCKRLTCLSAPPARNSPHAGRELPEVTRSVGRSDERNERVCVRAFVYEPLSRAVARFLERLRVCALFLLWAMRWAGSRLRLISFSPAWSSAACRVNEKGAVNYPRMSRGCHERPPGSQNPFIVFATARPTFSIWWLRVGSRGRQNDTTH